MDHIPAGMEYLQEDREALLPVPEWMRGHQHYLTAGLARLEKPIYLTSGVHTGQVNIPGLRKGTRIVSMKVPPLYHPEHDASSLYTVLAWIKDIKDWCSLPSALSFHCLGN